MSATDDAPLTVDDIVTGPTAEGPGLRFLRSDGLMTWQALGMIRSTELRIEGDDVDSWEPED